MLFHKEIDSFRSMIPLPRQLLPSLSGWVWSDLNSSWRIQKFKSETVRDVVRCGRMNSGRAPFGSPILKIPSILRKSIPFEVSNGTKIWSMPRNCVIYRQSDRNSFIKKSYAHIHETALSARMSSNTNFITFYVEHERSRCIIKKTFCISIKTSPY